MSRIVDPDADEHGDESEGDAPDPKEFAALAFIELDRTEIFSDGVLGIALTLLALNLSIAGYRQNALASKLFELWPTYLAFLASFIFVGVMWMNHHASFDRLKAVSISLQWANMAVLLGAVVLSYPTAVLAEAFQSGSLADERSAVVLYGLLAAVMGFSWCLFFLIILRSPRLWEYPGDRRKWKRVATWAFGGAFGYFIAIAAGLLINPYVALVLFFVLVLYRSTQATRIASN
jgi:uncharacterized membrane protein